MYSVNYSKIQEILNSKTYLDPGVSKEGSWACGHHQLETVDMGGKSQMRICFIYGW